MLRLSSKWADFFRSQPETGMGYVIATVVLKDGRRYPRVAITGGIIDSIEGYSSIPFVEAEIAEFVVTHDKTRMRRNSN